jgi:hypothetical protein
MPERDTFNTVQKLSGKSHYPYSRRLSEDEISKLIEKDTIHNSMNLQAQILLWCRNLYHTLQQL